MSLETWIVFVLFWAAIVAAPGPNAAFTVATTMANGLPRALMAPLGIALTVVPHALVSALGLGALLLSSATLFTLVKWLGVAYLLWIGIQQWRRGTALTFRRTGQSSARKILLQGFLVSMFNPKTVMAYVAVYPQFIVPAEPLLPQMALLMVSQVLVALLVYGTYVGLASRLRAWLGQRRGAQAMRHATGTIYLAGAAGLALAGRNA